MINIYIASKIGHAHEFRILRSRWKEDKLSIHSRWLDQADLEPTASPDDFRIFWRVDHSDVIASHVLLVYGEKEDELKGALVEVGIALEKQIPVIIVGECRSYGSWRHHPGVIHAKNLTHAKEMILRLFFGESS